MRFALLRLRFLVGFQEIEELAKGSGCRVRRVGCLGGCDSAPCALIVLNGRERLVSGLRTVEKSLEVVRMVGGGLEVGALELRQGLTVTRRLRLRQQACVESKWNAALQGMREEIVGARGKRRWQLQVEFSQLLHRAGRLEEALQEVREVLSAVPSLEVIMEVAQIYSKMGRVDEITALEKQVRSICCDPEDFRLEMELTTRLGILKGEAVDSVPGIEDYALWRLQDVTVVSRHSAVYHFVSEDRQRGTPNPRGRGLWPKTWHVTLLAQVGANAEGPLPWIERDYTPISTAQEWEQGQCDLLIKVYKDGQATSWLRQQALGTKIWLSKPMKTLSVPSLVPDLDPKPFRPASYLLLLAGTGIVAAAQVLHHAEMGKCFGGSPSITAPIHLIQSCRADDVLMSADLERWSTAGLLKSWSLLLTDPEPGPLPFPDAPGFNLTRHVVRSRISKDILQRQLEQCHKPCRVLVSGPAGFNAAAQSLLVDLGCGREAMTVLSA